MNINEQSNEIRYMDMIKANRFYTQILTGERIRNHDVVYIFDEVGCGKTISAIIGIASIINKIECEDNTKGWKILVVTPKSVCNQFASEINSFLNLNDKEEIISDISGLLGNKLDKKIKSIVDMNKVIVITNPHKASKLVDIQWDLLIIDEAHDIVCNNQKQTQIYHDDKINQAYENYCKCENINQERIKEFNTFIESHKNDEKSIKYLALVESDYNIGSEHRLIATTMFKNMCSLKSEKLIFLTATPYKNDKDIDFFNYALMASKIATNFLFTYKYLPELDWVQSFYTGNIDVNSLSKMENSNTSLMFKEITQAIIEKALNKNSQITGKIRNVELWDESNNFSLKCKLKALYIDTKDKENKNRFIIFVSNSAEGQYIFEKIFPSSNYNIVTNEHCYEDEKTGIKCEFIMNKFDNSYKLKNYSSENNAIPDILIVTWQVAQVGVNLPTFNYVINYSIPPIAGYLEQRYGRIDRLNSKNNILNNIYYLDNNPKSYLYHPNLIRALSQYSEEILNSKNNLPVKNLLICKNLKVPQLNSEKLYEALAFYIYLFLNEEPKISDKNNEICDIQANLDKTIWKSANISTNNCGKLIVNDKEYCNFIKQTDDEPNENSLTKTESNKDRIRRLCENISEIEQLNGKINTINGSQLTSAGSIIFWNEEKQNAIINCNTIVEKIENIKNKF